MPTPDTCEEEKTMTDNTWKVEFDKKFVDVKQISEDEFDFSFKGNVQELYNFIRTTIAEAKAQGAKALADEISDQISEFGDNPKDALACIEETINIWFMTPEQQKVHNEGHDY